MATDDTTLFMVLAERLGGLGLECEVRLGTDDVPDQLFVQLAPNEHGERLALQMHFLGELSDPSVLQYYVGIPLRARPGAIANVTRFLNGANAALPIGNFGVLEDEGLLYFRANIPIVIDPLDVHLVSWTVKMIDFIVHSLGSLIEQLAMGLEFDLARRLLDETLAHLMET